MTYDERYNAKIKIYPDGNFKSTYCNKFIFSNEVKPSKQKCDDVNFEKENNGTYQDWELSLKDWCIYPGWDISLKKDIDFSHMITITAKQMCDLGISTIDDLMEYEKIKKEKVSTEKSTINFERAIKRAKEKIFDLVYINDFKYFVTITFDTKKVDSTNANLVIKKLRSWLCNQKNRLNMEYVLVPEYHKKGGIHCHLLITDYPTRLLEHAQRHTKGGELVYNKDGSPCLMYTNKGQPVYNMLGWKYGFSTCIPIYKAVNESNLKLAHYITKYMTKDVHKIFGKFYWSSKGLKREVDTQVFNCDYDALPLKEYEIPNTNIRLKYDSQFNYNVGGKNNENEK